MSLLYALKSATPVPARFGFEDTTEGVVRARFAINFVASLSEAMGHRG